MRSRLLGKLVCCFVRPSPCAFAHSLVLFPSRSIACLLSRVCVSSLHDHSLLASPSSEFTMSFLEQPNEILNMILNTEIIPIRQRLRLRAVSPRWLAVLEDGFALERTALVLLDRDYIEENACFYTIGHAPEPALSADDFILQTGNLTDELIHLLVRLFPRTTELTLAFGAHEKPSSLWSKVPLLLNLLAANLTALKLYGIFDHYTNNEITKCEMMKPFGGALNALPSLTSLSLHGYQFYNRLVPYLRPLLSRLEKFSCPELFLLTINSRELLRVLSSSLSPRCTHLMLCYYAFARFDQEFHRQLCNSLTHLHLSNWSDTDWDTLSGLHGLTSLALDFNETTSTLDPTLLCRLIPFKRLTELKLFRLDFPAPLAHPSKNTPPLPAIKYLTLGVFYYSFHVFHAIHAWFPSLVHLDFITDGYNQVDTTRFGELPYSVKLHQRETYNIRLPAWM